MLDFVERQNKHRALGQPPQKGANDFNLGNSNPRSSAGDFLLRQGRESLGLSYTRRQAIKRYRVLIKSGHAPKAVLDSFSAQTFPNVYQSIKYHLRKHGRGLTPGQYAETALAFFIENYYRSKLKADRLGQLSWNIRGQKGGWWTRLGRIITFWF